MVDRMRSMITVVMNNAHARDMLTRHTKIHRISVYAPNHQRITFTNVKSIALIVIALNRLKVADDVENRLAAAICVAVLIIENAIRRLIGNVHCERPTKTNDPTKRSTNKIQMSIQVCIVYLRLQLKHEVYKDDQEKIRKTVDHRLGMVMVRYFLFCFVLFVQYANLNIIIIFTHFFSVL